MTCSFQVSNPQKIFQMSRKETSDVINNLAKKLKREIKKNLKKKQKKIVYKNIMVKHFETLSCLAIFKVQCSKNYLTVMNNFISYLKLTKLHSILRHSAHEAVRIRFERFSTPGRARKTNWKQVLIVMCALT